MAYPTIYPLNYSYTGFQQAQGNNSFPGTQLDADLHGLRDSVSALALFTGGIIRSDGRLKNGVVTRDSLAPALQTAGIAPANAWTSATSYAVDIAVVHNSNLYRALVAHTSGVFATDLAVGKWVLVSALIGNDQAITPEQFRLAIDADWTNAFQRLASHVNTYGGCRVECGQNVVYNIWSAGSTPTTLMVFNNVQGLTINSNSARFTTDNLFAGFETPRLVFFRGSSGIINGLDFEQTGLTTLQSQKGAVLFEIGDHSGGPSSSNVILNNIRQFGGTQGITVAPGQPYALRSAARIEVNNAEFDTVFYPQLFQGAGEQYTARGVSTKYAGRSYFSEGSGQHDVDMVSQGSASGNADCVIVSYARPLNIEERNSNSSIKLRYRNLGRVADTISEACVVLAMRQTVAPVSITAAANNGSGKTRLTVDSAADMATGQEWFFSSATGTTAINGKHVVTKIDATHIDLLDVTYVANSPAGNVRVPVTIKNIDLDFEVSSSDGYQQPPLLLTYKNKHDLSIDDSGVPCGYTIENLSIRGTAKGYNNGTRALDLFSNDYGSLSTGHSYGVWTGETIRNVSVNGLTLEGTSSDVKINATDMINLELINIVSASGFTWTVTDPNVVAYRRNVIATGLTDPVLGFF
ncbi:MAG: hypothetical protein JWO28_3342 [Hyphomicrobiales bacterium]|nr:hypothetical protein [Hyphomicrobiales bacterium]